MKRIMLVLAGLGALAAAGMATATVFSVSITGTARSSVGASSRR